MDGDHPSLSRYVVSFSLMVCSGQHIFLRLLSLLRVMNMSPSQNKKNKMSKLLFTDLFCLFQIQEAEKRQGSLGSQEWAIITLQQYVLRYHKPLAQAGHWRKHLKFS